MDILGRKALLFDFYGALLTPKQQEVYNLSIDEDMSLGEIGSMYGISRQAVADMLKRTDRLLEDYESRLGLAERFLTIKEHLTVIRNLLPEGEELNQNPTWIRIKKEIDALDEIERT